MERNGQGIGEEYDARPVASSRALKRLVLILALTVPLPSRVEASHTPSRHPTRARAKVVIPRERLAQAEAQKGGRFQVALDGGGRAELTLDPRIQKMSERVLKSHHTPYAAAVVLSVDDGRVLAMAGHSTTEPEKSAAELCLTPWAPAASIFKLVTSAALLASGVRPGETVCYHGGIHSVESSNLSANPRLDDNCHSFAFGLAKSQNAIIARLATEHLDTGRLSQMARAFGFGETLPGDVSMSPSTAAIPDDSLAFARTAAGFWRTTLSPLHGAWMAATIARAGMSPPIHLVSRLLDDHGSGAPEMTPSHRVLDEGTARTLARMMVGTTEFGTAHRGFHDHDGKSYLRFSVAGKTGSLTRRDGPYLGYSWFVGFAPASHPEVAVAVLLGNGEDRVVKAHAVAREILEGYFERGNREIAKR